MKKLHFLLIAFSLLYGEVQSQSSSIFAGFSFIPRQSQGRQNCYSYWSPYLECNAFNWRPGYQFYGGFGKSLRLTEHWSLLGTWQVQHQVNPALENSRRFDLAESGQLLTEGKSNSKYRITSTEISLSLERALKIGNYSLDVSAGGYARLLLEDWKKTKWEGTRYFEIIEGYTFNVDCQCWQFGIISKTKLDPPEPYENEKNTYNTNDTRAFNFGILGGVTFPLAQSKDGMLKGRLAVRHDLKPFFKNDLIHDLYQTSLMAGLVYEPVNISRPNLKKPDKRTLSSGIYWGGSLHTLFLSMDGVWLSSKNLGIDLAARYGPFKFDRYPKCQVFAGPVYRLGNSRFFARTGVAYTWIIDDEYYDETKLALVLGGKYVWPFSKNLGFQVNAGWAVAEGDKPGIDLGFGLLFMPR